MVAQCRQKPELHAKLVPDIRTWLGSHRVKAVGARNIESLEGFFADPTHKSLATAPASSEMARRERTHRLVLLGAWVLARRKDVKELRELIYAELARFIAQGRRVDYHRALLTDVIEK